MEMYYVSNQDDVLVGDPFWCCSNCWDSDEHVIIAYRMFPSGKVCDLCGYKEEEDGHEENG